MPITRVHLTQRTPDHPRAPHLCGVLWGPWTREVQAVTCPRCISVIELNPA